MKINQVHYSLFMFFVCSSLFLLAGCTKVKSVNSCGDGFLDPGEECDTDIGDNTCASLGHYKVTGTLTCKSDCTFDRSDCGGWCGDSTVQPESAEVCDGHNLNMQTCISRGFHGGELACSADCKSFDESSCREVGWCGDSLVQAGFQEVCDREELNGQTCGGLGYYGGELACAENCRAFDQEDCMAFGRCGDGVVQDGYGEVCDQNDLNGETCVLLGYHGGQLACAADCLAFNEDACIAAGRCGDATIQGVYGEVCDGHNLDGQTCITRGYYGGDLACSSDCTGFDESDCMLSGWCGDDVIQGSEQCDGSSLDGETCQSRGFYPGTLTCQESCQFDVSGCGGHCGDGIAQAPFESCDGTDLGGHTCRTRNFFTGVLGCSAGCQHDVSGCQNVLQVAAGYAHTCALLADSTLRCWGENSSGQLGDGTTVNRSSPVKVTGLSGVSKVVGGGSHTCAVMSDMTMRCWGRNNTGQLGINSTTNRSVPETVLINSVTEADAGNHHTCARKNDGTIWCWGSNVYGQLGDNTTSNKSVPAQVSGITTGFRLGLGGSHSCAILANDKAHCWGRNNAGQLGDNTTTTRLVPVAVTTTLSFEFIKGGILHTCAKTKTTAGNTSHVHCWGGNEYGQLGDGTTTQRLTPVSVNYSFGINNNARALSVGNYHGCMLVTSALGLYCWGRNQNGQVGASYPTNQVSPLLITTSTSAYRLDSLGLNGDHSCAVQSSSSHNNKERVICWGDNQYGQVGDGTQTMAQTPVIVLP